MDPHNVRLLDQPDSASCPVGFANNKHFLFSLSGRAQMTYGLLFGALYVDCIIERKHTNKLTTLQY